MRKIDPATPRLPEEKPSTASPKLGPAWLEEAVLYQIYPQSYADSNGDGIGDLPGLIGKLDYIGSLGVTAIWLNPIFLSPFQDAGYDVADFCRVAPRYGTNADARRLFREAHKRGLRVILDLVAGHTSIRHPWFQASCKPQKNEFSDFYIWTDGVWARPPEGDWVKGFCDRDGNFMTNFFWFQPALNYGFAKPHPGRPWELPPEHPTCMAVREKMREVMKFWLDAGCDGFRVDMASSLVKGGSSGKALRALWQDFRGWLDANYPEAVLISEWGDPSRAIAAGFHIDFLLHFGEPAYKKLLGGFCGLDGARRNPPVYFQREGGIEIREFLENYLKHYRKTKKLGYISMPTANHDFPRPSRGRTPEELRVIMAMLLTMPGVPTIYYGDEIGMRWLDGLVSKEGSFSTRTGSRTPMQWNRRRNAGFSSAPPQKLYLPVDPDPDAPCVESAGSDPSSLLALVRKLISLRKSTPALGNLGGFEPVVTGDGKPFVYRRKSGREKYVVAINPKAESRSCVLRGNLEAILAEGIAFDGTSIVANPVSFGIFREAAKR